MVRVIQISDTHLSPIKQHFGANWAPVVRWIAAHKPDLIIHTGDVTVDAADRRIAWFTHRPLFIDTPDEGDTGYWSVKPRERRALLDLAQRHHVEIIATGHLHRWHDFALNGTRYIWAPSSGFLVGENLA